jgi:outer membrane protein assembly factor BamB
MRELRNVQECPYSFIPSLTRAGGSTKLGVMQNAGADRLAHHNHARQRGDHVVQRHFFYGRSSGMLVPLALLLSFGSMTRAVAQDRGTPQWTQFRGAIGDGIVAGSALPMEWSPERNVIWKSALPGIGWSQPVAWDERVYVTTAESDDQAKPDVKNRGPGVGALDFTLGRLLPGAAAARLEPPDAVFRWKVLCLDASSGKILWQQVAREGRPTVRVHPNNTYASETPVTDGQRLIAYFGMTGIYCYDVSGSQLWTRELGSFPMQYGWGTGSSPILFGDHVYVQCDNEQSSFLVALDKSTGQDVWRAEREEQSNWSTPYIWRNKLRTELVVAGGTKMRSYDPETGELLWSMKASGRTSTTPVGNSDLLFVDSYDRLTGRTGTFAAIRPGAAGEISLDAKAADNQHLAWSVKISGCRVASPLIYDDRIYLVEQLSGVIRCLDAATGKELSRKRLPGATGFTASPLVSAGKLYLFDQNGTTIVAQADPELSIVARNELNAMCWASPAVLGERLLIRTVDHLYCIGQQ